MKKNTKRSVKNTTQRDWHDLKPGDQQKAQQRQGDSTAVQIQETVAQDRPVDTAQDQRQEDGGHRQLDGEAEQAAGQPVRQCPDLQSRR